MRDAIILFTENFPFGKGESFLETEILFLSEKFKQVVIIPNTCPGEARALPENCRVVELKANFIADKKIRHYFFRNLFAVFDQYFFLLMFSEQRLYYLKNLIAVLSELSVIVEESKLYYTTCKEHLSKTDLLYFYWFRRPLVQFALLKAEGKITHKFISRAHGWDFDPERNPLGFYPYREIELRQIDTLSVVSAWGATLLKRIYPKYSQKISSAYLGVTDNGYSVADPGIGHFHLISCSTVWEIKRLDRIIDMLRHIKFNLVWTHIGDGPLLEEIKRKAADFPANIKCEFLGARSNSFILDYYSKVHCDLFINVSRKEGLPVSLMEAISFGIPVMGIDMAGIPEVVNKDTGFLLGKEFDANAAAEIITKYHHRPAEEKLALRKSARNYFLGHFSAEVNYNKFIVEHLLT